MKKYSYDEIKIRLEELTAKSNEPELSLFLFEKEYMIIHYADHCSFQRCGGKEVCSGETNYSTLDELYNTITIDDILLARDWGKIKEFYCFEFQLYGME